MYWIFCQCFNDRPIRPSIKVALCARYSLLSGKCPIETKLHSRELIPKRLSFILKASRSATALFPKANRGSKLQLKLQSGLTITITIQMTVFILVWFRTRVVTGWHHILYVWVVYLRSGVAGGVTVQFAEISSWILQGFAKNTLRL